LNVARQAKTIADRTFATFFPQLFADHQIQTASHEVRNLSNCWLLHLFDQSKREAPFHTLK
jgi:hypothetical protein